MPTTQAPAGTSQTPEPSGSTGKVGETDESLSRTVSFDAGGSGTIPGNSAKTGGAFYNAGTVIMNGGSISGNTASENYGGAVFNQGKCTVNGGSITDNTCGGGVGAALGGDLPYGGKKTERSSPSTSWKPSAAERTATGSRSAVLLPLSRAAGAEATTGAPSPTSPMKIPPIKYARIAADTQYL